MRGQDEGKEICGGDMRGQDEGRKREEGKR